MAAIQIQCEDEVLTAELVTHLLAFAQARNLGVEHNCVKDWLVLYRGETSSAKAEPVVAPSPRSNIIAFPTARAVRTPMT